MGQAWEEILFTQNGGPAHYGPLLCQGPRAPRPLHREGGSSTIQGTRHILGEHKEE